MYERTAEAFFDAAHFLNHPGKSGNLHGHRWRVVARLQGETEDALPVSALQDELCSMAEGFDHRLLIERGSLQLATMDAFESEGFELVALPFPPTAGQLARYMFCELRKHLPVCAVTVFPQPGSGVSYEEAP